jgi:hypothetical protein
MLITSKIINILLVLYLVCNELLIAIVILIRFNEEYIDFKLEGYKISIWCGIAKANYIIICKKVVFVHTQNQGRNLEIFVLSSSKFRNKKIQSIDINFLKKYPYVAQMYNKMKIENPEENYFYFIIKHGGFIKYILLDELYKSCVGAIFSDDAIEKIKEYREYSINPH